MKVAVERFSRSQNLPRDDVGLLGFGWNFPVTKQKLSLNASMACKHLFVKSPAARQISSLIQDNQIM